jgi:integrase
MNINRTPTVRGQRSVLTYWYRRHRYRPVLGYNLTSDQEREEAHRVIALIHQHGDRPPDINRITFASFIPFYLQRLSAKRATDASIRRNTSIIVTHLVPFFGESRLQDLRLMAGDGYIQERRVAGAAEGTIERECAVLCAILNYAVDCDYLQKNPFKRMAVPQGHKRSRTINQEDLDALAAVAFPQLWRAIIVALNTGLREQRIVDIDQAWISICEDGPWLFVPKARTKHKNNPAKVPLNRLAAEALQLNVTYLHGKRIFDNWHDGEVLGAIFRRKVQKAGLTDLCFHDLRHSFATALENLGVDTRTIDLLMGHKIQGVGEDYRHGGPGRDKQLRDAVNKLDTYWRSLPLTVPLPTGSPHRDIASG